MQGSKRQRRSRYYQRRNRRNRRRAAKRTTYQYPLTRHHVEALARGTLQQTLGWEDQGPKATVVVVLQILLLAAAHMASIAAVCQDFGGLCDQTVYDFLDACLPARIETLGRRLNQALRQRLPRRLTRRKRRVAVDWHLIPYHGEPKKKKRELLHSQPKSGTTKFHGYATACVVESGLRFTVALTHVYAGEAQVEVMERLLEEIRQAGVRIKVLLLDRAFFSVTLMHHLQSQQIPFLMPVVLRGRRPKPGKPSKGMRRFLRQSAGWHSHTLSSGGKTVTFRVCVTSKSYRHHRTQKRRTKKLLYAAWGVSGQPREIRELYRTRFGIETSYRQLKQARIQTSTRDPIERLLYVGIALVLRNVWVWVHWTYLAEHGASGSESDESSVRLHLEKLRFRRLLRWIILAITCSPRNRWPPS